MTSIPRILERKKKRALSEMVSYILLIVIALGLSVGVYAWLKGQLPNPDQEKCSEDVAIIIKDYNCTYPPAAHTVGSHNITLELKNSGSFNINGVYVRAANETGKIAVIMLESDKKVSPPNLEGTNGPGRYDFQDPLKLQETKNITLNYTQSNKLEKIQIQPFVISKKSLLLCDNIAEINLKDCN